MVIRENDQPGTVTALDVARERHNTQLLERFQGAGRLQRARSGNGHQLDWRDDRQAARGIGDADRTISLLRATNSYLRHAEKPGSMKIP